MNRAYTFGKEGSSGGQFFDELLATIKLNDRSVPFTRMNLEYLVKQNYDNLLETTLRKAQRLPPGLGTKTHASRHHAHPHACDCARRRWASTVAASCSLMCFFLFF